MRNLKKVLSLVLALMMVLSVMVTASAAEFTDAESIQYTEAVEVLAGIGVIEGVENADGTSSYLPNDGLNREAAAAIIARLLNDGENVTAAVADALANPFTDVSGWSVNAIKWCYAQGIVDGVSATSFLPKDKLTGYAFAKMLLVALGIDGEYTGSAWKYNILVNADEAGLLENLPETILSAYLTREQAAQMAFNALFYYTEGSYGYAVYSAEEELLGYYPNKLDAARAAAELGGSYSSYPVAYNTNSLAQEYNLKSQITTPGIGVRGYFWYVDNYAYDGGSYNDLKDTIICDYVQTDIVVGTYTAANTWKDLSADLGMTKNYAAAVYANGGYVVIAEGTDEETGEPWTTNYYGVDFDSKASITAGDSNVTVTAVLTYYGEYPTIRLLYAAETLTSVDSYKYPKGHDYYGYYQWTFTDEDGEFVAYSIGGAKDFDEDVKYLVTPHQPSGTIINVAAAETVVGEITSTNATLGYVRLNGGDALYVHDGDVSSVPLTATLFYLNTAGDIIATGEAATAKTVYEGYVFVSTAEYIANAYSAGLVGASSEASITAKALVTTVDGEQKVVDLATRVYKYGTSYKTEYYLNGWNNGTQNSQKHDDIVVPGWYAYTTDDTGAYKLVSISGLVSDLDDAAKKQAWLNIVTVDGEATVETKYFLTAATKINFVTFNVDTGAVVTQSVTGYANITDLVAGNLNAAEEAIVVANEHGVISSITVYGTNIVSDAVNYVVYIGEGEKDEVNGYQQHLFYVNGEIKPYIVYGEVLPEGTTYGTVLNIKTDVYGCVNVAEKVESESVTVKAIASDGTYFVDTTNGVHMLAEGYTVYDKTANYGVAELAIGDTVDVITYNGAVVMIVVTAHAE